MVTHTAPLDEYLERLIGAIANLADVMDSIHGQQLKEHESRQVAENDMWQEVHNISDHLANMTTALEQFAMEMDQ